MNEKYLPLYRKYRPQKLDEIVGQEHIKQALTSAINLNKISHAYLFTGPRGTGKTSTARIFAKSLNCKSGPTVTPCEKCESCIDITKSIPMDVIEIDAASNRKVEDTQNILDKILYAPVYGKYKIYIIDEVHMLSTQAFNSLLKTLEEPPENVIFILATTEVHKVLDTIKSRCQRYDFRRITTSDITKHLRYIADKEKINITDDALSLIAKSSAGGMRDSIALLDQVSVLGLQNAVTVDDINNILGRISFGILSDLADTILTSKPQNALEQLEKIYSSGNEPVQILSNLLNYLKDLLIVKNSSDEIIAEITQLNSEQIKILKKQVQNIETHQLVSLLDKTSEYIKELKRSNNPYLWLQVAIIDLANLTENTKLADLQQRLQMLESGEVKVTQNVSAYNTPPAPVSKPEVLKKPEAVEKPKEIIKETVEQKTTEQPTEPAFSPMPKSSPVKIDENDISVLWAKIIENISSVPTKSLLKQWANPVEITAEKTVITINSSPLLRQFESGAKRDALIFAVDTLFGQTKSNVIIRLPEAGDVKVETKPEPKPAKTVVPKKEEQPEVSDEEIQEAKETVDAENKTTTMHSQAVNTAVDLFDGKIIE